MNVAEEIVRPDGLVDLRLLFARVWDRRVWVASITLVVTAAFAAAAFLMDPVYKATAVLMPSRATHGAAGSLASAFAQLGGAAALLGVDPGSEAHTQESLAVLQSREFTGRFIEDHGLLPELFHDRWDEKTGTWKGPKDKWPTLSKAVTLFEKKVREVNFDRKTGLVSLDIEWRDPVKAARWANELVARVNREMRERAIARSEAALGFLEKERANASVLETKQTINRLIEAQLNERVFANVTQEYALRVVDPATPPERDDVVRPKKGLLIVLGVGTGLFLAVFIVLLIDPRGA